MKIHAVMLSAVAVAALVASGCGGEGGPEQTTGVIDVFDLRPGHCFADAPPAQNTFNQYGRVELFECDDLRADYTVTHTFVVDRDGSYPGPEWLDEQAGRECSSSAGSYFGPTRESWEDGDRAVTCVQKLAE